MASSLREPQSRDCRVGDSRKVQVTILASEWGSSKGGLSTINRELAIQLAKYPEVEITFFLPQCSKEDKELALRYNVKIVEATPLSGFEQLDWLCFPPEDLQIDIIVGHGVKLGKQAQIIKRSKRCKWVQVVHTDPEELGMFKNYSDPISKGEEKHKIEVELCEMADHVVGVGPKLSEAFRSYLRSCQKDDNVLDLTPGVFVEFEAVKQALNERQQHSVLVFGRGDVEDFELKGFDIAGKAVAELEDTRLVFVGAPDGKHEEIAKRLTACGVPPSRLRVRGFVQDRESLRRLFQEVDLVVMPSRTEGFGLTGLEALSAGLPVLVSRNTGFGEALRSVPFGSTYVVNSEEPADWTSAIKTIWFKYRRSRLEEAETLRESYGKKYNWAKQIKDLIDKMISWVYGMNVNVLLYEKKNYSYIARGIIEHLSYPTSDVIEKIRQLFKTREQRLLPVPWLEDFSFHMNDIFTRLRIVGKGKTQGVLNDDITDMTAIFMPIKEMENGEGKEKKPRTVLIEGDPGMGKTTYCQKLAYDWATKQNEWDPSFPEIEVLLLLKCHEFKSDIWEAIDDQILPEEMDDAAKECFFKFIRENQSKVLLVLDGLDEADPSKLKMIFNLVEGKQLSDCYIVLTSRHEVGRKVWRYCDILWEIVGFTQEDAKSFVRQYFKNINKEQLASKLLEMVWSVESKKTEELRELTKNPLNTALLCVIFEDFEGVFPTSRTQLYIEIVLCVLRRYEQKQGLSSENEDLMAVYKEDLLYLGEMALQSLRKGELYFEQHKSCARLIALSKFGFLSLQAAGSKRRARIRYAFLHKSFQEFFSGFYLACKLIEGDINCESVVTDRRYNYELKQVFLFTIGILASTSEKTAESFVESMAVNINSDKSRLLFALDSNSSLTYLNFGCNTISDASATSLSHALAVNSSLTELVLEESLLCDSGAASLSQALAVNSSLTNLNLRVNRIGDSGAESLSKALAVNSSLTNLDLSENSLGDSGAASLSWALAVNSSLTNLNLRVNRIGDSGAESLSKALAALAVNSSLTNLDLSENRLGDSGAASLFKALAVNSYLTNLNLRDNRIGDSGTESLFKALAVNSSLTNLDLSENRLGDSGAASLSWALAVNSSLTNLNLRKNGISYSGAASLSQALAVNSSLTKLNLSRNSIGDAGAASLSQALAVNSSLTELNLRWNVIADSGAAELSNVWKVNATAKLFW
ncbi:unnamed protein product [Porites evermanni]|uniref:NACHT domain-containing protein n=1 Tax=Porites evermanni TaxID=104178 RepID=A0ABN8PLP2_9CNID|nr:unnamed protein product [Porites evermanni]